MKLYQTLRLSLDNSVAVLSLHRAEEDNRFNQTMLSELKDVVMSLDQNEGIKILLIKAEGPYFSAGLDPAFVQQIQTYTFDQQVADSSFLAEIFLALYRSTKVVMAQVEGDALGLGAGLLTICDFVWATPEVRIAFHEVKFGMIPSIAINFLLRKIGETRTKELLLSGHSINAQTAAQYNLINQVLPAEDIDGQVAKLANDMARQNSGASMQLIKKMIADIQEFPLERAMSFSAKMNAYARTTEDGKKGLFELGKRQ